MRAQSCPRPSPAFRHGSAGQGSTGRRSHPSPRDRGYYDGKEILACEQNGVTAYVPRFSTSNAKAEGRYGKQDFVYNADEDVYVCPNGERLSLPFYERRRRKSHALLLDNGLRRLSAEGKMHHRQGAPC